MEVIARRRRGHPRAVPLIFTWENFMKRSHYGVLLGLTVLGLGFLWGISLNLHQFFQSKELLSPQLIDSIEKIEFYQGGQELKLIRNSAGWKVEPPGYQADAQKIKTWLKGVSLISIEMVITKSPKRFENFGVIDNKQDASAEGVSSQRLVLKGKGNHPLLDVIVGNQRPSLKSDAPKQYLRFFKKTNLSDFSDDFC